MSQAQGSNNAPTQYDNIHVDGSALAIFGDVYNTRDQSAADTGTAHEASELDPSLLYYDTMHDRMDQVIDAEDDTCKWIWTTKFAEWLSNAETRVFWMSGKPGCGKSTLMKYLTTTVKLHDYLYRNGAEWQVLNFYFDFRGRDKRENSLDGLFRTLLYSLIQSRKDVLPKQFPDYRKGETIRLITLEAAFKFALDTIDLNVIIFIDGLDEYVGNVMELVQRLLPLSQRKNVKLCMTSRREAAISYCLQKYPSFHISDPNTNEKGIAEFIKLRFQGIEDFDPSYWSEICSAAVPQTIQRKAEGVFLWVSLASKEVIEASAQGATVDEIIQLVDDLPEDVGRMYQRIVDRIPLNRRVEAAVIYSLVAESSHRISVGLLRATLYFITCELCVPEVPRLDLSIPGVGRRLMGSLGGLLEVCHKSSSQSTESYDNTPEIRLMHETVRAFSTRTRWAYDQLPSPFQAVFPDRRWARLSYEAINSATKCLGSAVDDIEFCSQVKSFSYTHFQQRLKSLAPSVAERWTRLLYFGLKYIVVYAEEEADCKDDQFRCKVEQAMEAPLSALHAALFEPKIFASLKELPAPTSEDRDFTLAATHGACRYLISRMQRLKALTNIQRDDLALRMIECYHQDNCLNQSESETCIKLSLEDVRKTLDSILALNSRISSIHLNIFLILGYSTIPRFVKTHSAQDYDDSIQREPGSATSALLVQASRKFGGGSPLFTWACDNAIEGATGGLTMQFQLSVLRTFGIDLNKRSSAGYPIVHHLISVHVLDHTILGTHGTCRADPEMNRTVEKLYALDDTSVDFAASAFGQTPLEVLEAGMSSFKLTTPDDRLAVLNVDRIQLRLEQLQFMLRFKYKYGHLPQPMILADPNGEGIFEFLRQKKCKCEKCSGRQKVARDTKLRLETLGPDSTRKLLPSVGSCFD